MYGSADADRGGYAGVPRVYREAYIQEGVPVSLLPWWVWGGIPSLPPPSLLSVLWEKWPSLRLVSGLMLKGGSGPWGSLYAPSSTLFSGLIGDLPGFQDGNNKNKPGITRN